jgi:hypothetical protein
MEQIPMRSSNCGLSVLILFLAGLTVLGQSSSEKPAKAKRVFTNEDLGRIRDKYGSDPDSEPATQPGQPADTAQQSVQTGEAGKTATPESKAYWVAKLKETESALAKAKEQDLKFQGLVAKYEQKLRDAKGDFHTKTSQEQVADTLKSLSRAKDQIKQGEDAKSKLLAEAAEKGFKPADLKETPR